MRVVLLWLINKRGEILLARRAASMDSNAGVWGPSVSGKIEVSEEPDKAALREAKEELGIFIKSSPKFLHKTTHNHSSGVTLEFEVYYIQLNSDFTQNFILESQEVSEVKWVTIQELIQLSDSQSEDLIISSDTKVWGDIIKHLKSILD